MHTTSLFLIAALLAQKPEELPKADGNVIGLGQEKQQEPTKHPDAQWFPDAGLGLFIHWGLSSVRAINLSWPMMDGRGAPGQQITPNEYWKQAQHFNPAHYDPDKWLKAAKLAGFTYAVFTARHHEGFAMWPSEHGDFNTKNHMDGRDLVRPYVEAARRQGLKVGLYYSVPDWYFDREYVNFSRRPGVKVPLDADHKPRTTSKSPEETAKHRAEYAAIARAQIEELLTRYGKVDLLWFDGRVPGLDGDAVITQQRIRELQPGIVINPRLHHRGDYRTYERRLTTDKVATGWAEFCNTWTNQWPHVEGAAFRAPGFVLGQLVTARALRINYLLSVGPTAQGQFIPELYANMTIVGAWMKKHGRSVRDVQPLPVGESASVPATARGRTRYLFALPRFKEGGAYPEELQPAEDATLVLNAVSKPKAVRLLGGAGLAHTFVAGSLTITLPASKRTPLVDVVQVDL